MKIFLITLTLPICEGNHSESCFYCSTKEVIRNFGAKIVTKSLHRDPAYGFWDVRRTDDHIEQERSPGLPEILLVRQIYRISSRHVLKERYHRWEDEMPGRFGVTTGTTGVGVAGIGRYVMWSAA